MTDHETEMSAETPDPSDTPADETKSADAKKADDGPHIFRWLRKNFLTGLVIAAPVVITIYLTLWFITFVDEWVLPLIPTKYNPENYLSFSVPGLGVIITIVFLILLGALTANLFGRTIINYGERLVARMPIVRVIYHTLKQIFETIASDSTKNFTEVGLIEYPRKGLYAIAFVTTSTGGEIQDSVSEDLVSVFLPTTPNPTSGFLLFVPRRDIKILDMTVEEGAKLVISAGLVDASDEAVPAIDPDTVKPIAAE